jgi:cytochrome c
LFFLLSVSTVLLLILLTNGCASSNTWRDDFNATELDSTWTWKNGAPAYWSLSDGFLHIPASSSDTASGNLLLRSVASGDFTLTTRVFFEPNTNWQFAGLVIYQDTTNYLQFGRAFCSSSEETPSCAGNGIYFDNAQNNLHVSENFATRIDNPKEVYLRLERKGENVKGSYSSDGKTWTEIGTHQISADFQVNGVGLAASQDINLGGITADFDFFELTGN